jgi:aldose 1-epimerase
MAFTITETQFGTLPALAIEGTNTRVIVTLRGVTLIAWVVDNVELIDGYADELDFTSQAGMRSAMMIPFSNRIDTGWYNFEGRKIDFHATDPEHAGETVMHGMLRLEDFAIKGTVVGQESATIHFVSRALRPGAFLGYPFSIDTTIDLTVTETSLEFVIDGHNVGDTAAPFASGWHPYFRIGSAPIASLRATIPAETRIVPNSHLIPIEGDGAFEPVSEEWDFRRAKPLGSQVIDMAFSDLVPAADRLIHSTLTDPATRRTIDV